MMLIIFGALKLELSGFFKISKIFSKEKYHNFTIYKEYIYYKKENKSFPVLMVQTGTVKYDTKNAAGYLLQNILKIKALKKILSNPPLPNLPSFLVTGFYGAVIKTSILKIRLYIIKQ